MPGREAQRRLSCPQCGETVLSDDKFCFHCGKRLKDKDGASDLASDSGQSRRYPQWPLAIIGLVALVFAGIIVARQSHTIARLKVAGSAHTHPPTKATPGKHIVLHPVVTNTTTTYPGNLPSSAGWTPEVVTYHSVQIGLRLPSALTTSLGHSKTSWSWGHPSSPYQVMLNVVGGRASTASVALGPNTYGTPISQANGVSTQQLYVNWAPHQWVEVSMAVPKADANWLGSIAESVRIS